jgi:hypothetical protein
MKWNSKESVYFGAGKKVYKFGDKLPGLSDETRDDFLKKGLIVDDGQTDEEKRLALFNAALELGLSPHPKTGIEKLEVAIENRQALLALRAEAARLGVDGIEDLKYDELKKIVEENNESDNQS